MLVSWGYPQATNKSYLANFTEPTAIITNKHSNFYIYYISCIWNPQHCH